MASLLPLNLNMIKNLVIPRDQRGDKNTFGHSLIIGGSRGMMGSMVFCTKANIITGCGLTTAYCPTSGIDILQNSVPEAMCILHSNKDCLGKVEINNFNKYSSFAYGCGLGQDDNTLEFTRELISQHLSPLVIDADGLNNISKIPSLRDNLDPGTVLTPHDREFKRFFGPYTTVEDKLTKAYTYAKKTKTIVVCKGSPTYIVTPIEIYINTTGNNGMATAGSGDCLTGIITSLLAQKYNPYESAIIGVYLHGLAGDLACQKYTEYGVTASRIIESISSAFQWILHE
jgi:hydroxyethylthiazole kinase-like uncharacterized protein yjeF